MTLTKDVLSIHGQYSKISSVNVSSALPHYRSVFLDRPGVGPWTLESELDDFSVFNGELLPRGVKQLHEEDCRISEDFIYLHTQSTHSTAW